MFNDMVGLRPEIIAMVKQRVRVRIRVRVRVRVRVRLRPEIIAMVKQRKLTPTSTPTLILTLTRGEAMEPTASGGYDVLRDGSPVARLRHDVEGMQASWRC